MASHDSKPKVVLVDDSIDVHRLLKARLRNEQVELECVASGEEALDIIRECLPAAVLLDLDMPVMDGFQVLRALKDDPETMNIPVIVLSALKGSDDKVTAFDLGANDYVTKPFDLAELRARVRAAVRLSQLLALLAERADVDGLTGLGNRAHFDKRWAEQYEECKRYGSPLSLVVFDADLFKRINDTYGHPAGDEVLVVLADLITQECRASDIPCRYGGEEFVVIMPNTPPEDAKFLADRIRQHVCELVWPRHPEQKVTVSVGVAGTTGRTPAVSAEEWIERADKNLYSAKETGRNRVIASEIDTTPGMAKAG